MWWAIAQAAGQAVNSTQAQQTAPENIRNGGGNTLGNVSFGDNPWFAKSPAPSFDVWGGRGAAGQGVAGVPPLVLVLGAGIVGLILWKVL